MDAVAPEHEFMKPEEVAALLRVSTRHVRKLREVGLLVAHVSTHRPRYRREDVLDVAEFLGQHPLSAR